MIVDEKNVVAPISKIFDVIVVGSGPAAILTALRCRQAGGEVAIMSSTVRPRRPVIPETLPSEARVHWRAIGFDETFDRLGFRRQNEMTSAWGTSAITTRHTICNVHGPSRYVDRDVLDDALLRFARETCVVERHRRIASVTRPRRTWLVESDTGSLEGRVVVDATGRSSRIARQLGARRFAFDRQVCVSVAAIPAAQDAVADALVESAPDGWWFSAPRADGLLGVAWFGEADNLRRTGASLRTLNERLATTVHSRSRVVRFVPGTLRAAAARTDVLHPCAGDGWFAAGDAALGSDPLSSQGVLAALESARWIAALIGDGPRTTAVDAYSAYQQSCFRRLMGMRRHFYSVERRWPDSQFWGRRSGRTAEASEEHLWST